jgi:hypothetical protein
MGRAPWYIVVSFIRSMCNPQLHPLVCCGVLLMVMVGVGLWSNGGVMGRFEYHWRRVVCMLAMGCMGRLEVEWVIVVGDIAGNE